MNSVADVWTNVLQQLKKDLSETTITTWFDELTAVDIRENTFYLHCPNDFKKRYIESLFIKNIKAALQDLFSMEFEVKILDEAGLLEFQGGAPKNNSDRFTYEDFTFETFVVGPINEFIELIRAGRGSDFRAKYREADLLLVDDVQFVAGKEQVQNEFFHTFNNLYESGKQIVLTSDRPPSEMTLLDDRLRTRFEWGLLADVTPPDFETRLAIVKNKAAALGMELPDKIASYIAENVTANVRQLEGTVNKILAYKDLLGSEADEATVTRAMQDILKKSNEYIPTPDNILDYISKYYGIEKEIICGQQRVKDAVAARQIAMYLIRGMTNLPVVEIGKVFDNRDHSTVLYSLKQVEKQMKKDPAFAETVKEIKTNINNRH